MADIETLRAILDLRLEDLGRHPDSISLQREVQDLEFEISLMLDQTRERDAQVKADLEASQALAAANQEAAERAAAKKQQAAEAMRSPADRAKEVRRKREAFLATLKETPPQGAKPQPATI